MNENVLEKYSPMPVFLDMKFNIQKLFSFYLGAPFCY